MNTASRLQSAAPVNGILVGEQTQRATNHVIDYGEADPVVAKGKSEPIAVWEALQARSRFGVDVRQHGGAALVGRTAELNTLVEALARAQQEREPQLVTLVGVPGIGKSRLVWELFETIGRGDELVYWRQGRSLPYGEGVSFWALAEMVKAQAGILEDDDGRRRRREARPRRARRRRRRAGLGGGALAPARRRNRARCRSLQPRRVVHRLADVLRGARGAPAARARLRGHPLGRRRPARLHRPPRGLVEGRAAARAVHGAPGALRAPARLGWREAERTHARSVAALERRLRPRLLSLVLARTVLPAETQQALLERAGGNPLYAEQFARLYARARLGRRPAAPGGRAGPDRGARSTRSRPRRRHCCRTPR